MTHPKEINVEVGNTPKLEILLRSMRMFMLDLFLDSFLVSNKDIGFINKSCPYFNHQE